MLTALARSPGQIHALAHAAVDSADPVAVAAKELALALEREASTRATELTAKAGVPPVETDHGTSCATASEGADIERLQAQLNATADPAVRGKIAGQILQIKNRQASREQAK